MTDDLPTVLVIDDDDAVRDSLRILLGINGYATVSYASAVDFLAAWEIPRHGCVLADVRMPGMSGIELIGALRRRGCMLPVVIITGHGDIPMAVAALKAGALDFIEKPYHEQILLERLREATELGSRAMAEDEIRRAILDRLALLTGREREVMALVVEGLPNKIVAARLGISIRTVEIHRARVMEKSGANSLSDLVRFAMVAGEPEPGQDDG